MKTRSGPFWVVGLPSMVTTASAGTLTVITALSGGTTGPPGWANRTPAMTPAAKVTAITRVVKRYMKTSDLGAGWPGQVRTARQIDLNATSGASRTQPRPPCMGELPFSLDAGKDVGIRLSGAWAKS